MTRIDYIKDQCRLNKHEVLFRYDLKENKWFTHVYPIINPADGIRVELWTETLSEAVTELISIIRNTKRVLPTDGF
jgi:hypothetical protein